MRGRGGMAGVDEVPGGLAEQGAEVVVKDGQGLGGGVGADEGGPAQPLDDRVQVAGGVRWPARASASAPGEPGRSSVTKATVIDGVQVSELSKENRRVRKRNRK